MLLSGPVRSRNVTDYREGRGRAAAGWRPAGALGHAAGMSSSFFPERQAHGAPEDADQDEPWMSPEWTGPGWHLRPGLSALTVLLGRSSSTAVLVEGARAYPTGLVLRLVVQLRERGREARRRVVTELNVTHGRGRLDLFLPVGGLRWGVELADGGRVTTVDDYSPWNERPPEADERWTPDRPVLQGLGRPTVWGGSWSRDVWLWPLAPPGPLRFVCAWPDRGIDETSTTVDAGPLRQAADAATPYWE